MSPDDQTDMPQDPIDAKTQAAIIEEMETKPPGPTLDTPIGKKTLKRLERDSTHYNAWGITFFVIAALIGCGLVVVSYILTVAAVEDLNDAKNPAWMLILLIVRGVFFGGLSVGLLYGLLTVSTAFIDQAARFRKRLYSAHMINYALDAFHGEIKSGTVDLHQVVEVFNAWNHSVESAFSGLRFQKKTPDVAVGGKHLGVEVKRPGKRRVKPKET